MRSSPVISTNPLVTHSQSDSFDDDNHSSHPRQIEFHLTAFGRFFNVPVNPTQLIVQALPKYLDENPLVQPCRIASTTVLQVAAETTRKELTSLYARHAKTRPMYVRMADGLRRLSNDRPAIFIHLGVNMSSTSFNLELQARNEATFSCPDELAWRPIRHAIDPNDGDITVTHRTTLNLQALVHHLSESGYNVDISKDAGRFVCNWVYFNSLKLAKDHSARALFVHVPPFSVVPIDRQIQFVAALLDAITLHC